MFENSGFHCIIKTSNEFYYLIILTLQLLVLLKYKCQKYKTWLITSQLDPSKEKNLTMNVTLNREVHLSL